MWKRKSKNTLQLESKKRMVKYELFIIIILGLMLVGIYLEFGTFDNLITQYMNDPEGTISLILLPLFIYMGYRNYVLHGSIHERPGKICLNCGIGLGYSDDGWGFKSYGKRRKKWYQIKACKTPDKCDIAYQHEVEWIDEDKNV